MPLVEVVNPITAGDDTIAGDFGLFHTEIDRAMLDKHVELFKRAVIHQKLDPLDSGYVLALGRERAFANWDEDSLTLAVEAARDCLRGFDLALSQLQLASTTLPFADRSNSGVVADALQQRAEGAHQRRRDRRIFAQRVERIADHRSGQFGKRTTQKKPLLLML